jgi:hypothetical protein
MTDGGFTEPFRTYAPADWQGQQSTQLIHGDFVAPDVRNFSTSAHEIGVHVKCNTLHDFYPGNDRAGRSERVYTFNRKMGCRAHRTEPEFRDMRGVGQLTEYAAGIADPSTLTFKKPMRNELATTTMTRGAKMLTQQGLPVPGPRSTRSARSNVSIKADEPRTLLPSEFQNAPASAPPMMQQLSGREGKPVLQQLSGRQQPSGRQPSGRSGGSNMTHGAPEWNFGKLPGYTTHNTEYGIFPDVRPAPAGRSISGFPHRIFQDFY